MLGIQDILQKYNVDPERGFLPGTDPIQSLPGEYNEWESIAANLSSLLEAGDLRDRIDSLTTIEDPQFDKTEEWERAMLLLSYFAHSYIHTAPEPSPHLPASIAIPWIAVAKKLKRKPILSHSSSVLNNWRRLDYGKPISLDNISTLIQFNDLKDESWFFLVTVEIEHVGAKAIPLLIEVMNYINEGDYGSATAKLKEVIPRIDQITGVLSRMYESCDPELFYTRIRPFLGSFDKVEYRGTSLPLQSHHGGSAAQSSLIQFFDASLGIVNDNQATREYLQLMRQHMPYKHSEFLAFIESNSKIALNASKDSGFNSVYKETLDSLLEFRNEHYKMVAIYIMKQAKKTQSVAVGTGGTSPMEFLGSVKNQITKRS